MGSLLRDVTPKVVVMVGVTCRPVSATDLEYEFDYDPRFVNLLKIVQQAGGKSRKG